MTAAERKFLRRKGGLTGSQQAAMTSVEQCIKRGISGTSWLAMRELMHYDEGKPTEHVVVENPEALSQTECDEIREAMQKGSKT